MPNPFYKIKTINNNNNNNTSAVPYLCWCGGRPRLQTVAWHQWERRACNLWEHLDWNWRQTGRGKQRKKNKTWVWSSLLAATLQSSLGDKSCYLSICELQFVDTMLTYQRDSPRGTFLWLSCWFTGHPHTHPHPTTSTSIVQMLPSVYKTLALSPLWFCFKTLTANHFLWPESSINSCYLPIKESTVRQQGNTFLARLLQCRFCKAAEL